jgi:hypothetical protein
VAADTDSEWVSIDLARTELMRAIRRSTLDRLVRAREVLDSLILLGVTTSIFDAAGRLDPLVLRTLDACTSPPHSTWGTISR